MKSADGVQRVIGVGVVLTDPEGRILLGERIRADETPSWCLPGGAVEPGESFEAAAVRELAEETGITDAGPPRTAVIVLDHPGGTAIRVTAGVTMTAGSTPPVVTEPEVFASWRWFPPDDLPENLFPATAHLLSRLLGQDGPTVLYASASSDGP
ncbi:NUDIX hydrolase [Planomonospora corallina]|uniref:NUDIX hydrolase n=1 Tax=Planomonospora corallina TaxID=1806052 RepID=A0ABV8IHF0_9ACTN